MSDPFRKSPPRLTGWKNTVRRLSCATPDFPTKRRWLEMVFRRELRMAGLLEMPLPGTDGLLFTIPPGSVIGHEVLLYGLYEKDVVRCFESLIAPGDLVLDIGANLGQYTLLASNRAGAAGQVISIEPVPHIHRQLVRHLQVNGITNVTTIEAALGKEDGSVLMTIIADENDGMHHVAETESPEGFRVLQRRLDDVIREAAPQREVSVMKIDVEGWEENVFAGAEQVLAQHVPPTIFFECIEDHATRFGLSAHRLVTRFRSLDYRIFSLAASESPRELADGPPPIGICNLIACHRRHTAHLARLLPS